MSFRPAKALSKYVIVVMTGALLCVPHLGYLVLLAAIIGLYYTLMFANRLMERNNR